LLPPDARKQKCGEFRDRLLRASRPGENRDLELNKLSAGCAYEEAKDLGHAVGPAQDHSGSAVDATAESFWRTVSDPATHEIFDSRSVARVTCRCDKTELSLPTTMIHVFSES